MQALILATGEQNHLPPITETLTPPMVPVANRPVMATTLDLLARYQFKDILVSLHHLSGSVEAYFGTGLRWGTTLDYILQRDALGSAGSLKWAAKHIQQTVIVLPGNRIIDLDITTAVAHHRRNGCLATAIVHTYGSSQGGLVWLDAARKIQPEGAPETTPFYLTGAFIFEPEILDLIPARTPWEIEKDLLPHLLAAGHELAGYPMHGYWNPMTSFDCHQKAQHAVLHSAMGAEVLDHGRPPLRNPVVEGQPFGNGIWVGRNYAIHPTVRFVPPVCLGDNCQIGRDVELGPNAVIGKHVIVDEEATIANSTVMEGTYVGQLVNVDGRYVRTTTMVDVQSGQSLPVVDEFLLGVAETHVVDTGLRRFFDVLTAALFLTLSLPLMLLIGLSLLLTRGRIFQRVKRVTNTESYQPSLTPPKEHYRLFDMWQFHTRYADGSVHWLGRLWEALELHRLPELFNVLRGDMAIVGVKPLTEGEALQAQEEWQQQRFDYIAGMTGEWYVQAAPIKELDEVLIADTYYAATRSWRRDLRLLSQSPKTWLKRLTISGT